MQVGKSNELEKDSFVINGSKYDVPCVFQIWEKNFDDTKYLLEKFLSVQFETDEKKTYYMVKKK